MNNKKNYVIFPAFETNSVGTWFFAPNDGEFCEERECYGFGSVKYPEGSVYTGDIYYDGKDFNKLGYGQQDFSRSSIGNIIPILGERKIKFVGRYDYRETEWIYGNGVLYFADEKGTPTHFMKGFFSALDKTGEYEGEFDYSSLLDGYTPDMEFEFDEWKARIEAMSKEMSEKQGKFTLFLGDSYFDLAREREFAGENIFESAFSSDFYNIGIGGTTFADWISWKNYLPRNVCPERIVVNLGFNDIHRGRSAELTLAHGKELISILRELYPTARIYLIKVICGAPLYPDFCDTEKEYNALLDKDNALDAEILDWNADIIESGVNCFHQDGIHPNEAGYALLVRLLKNHVLE